jgi:hypothetical protein
MTDYRVISLLTSYPKVSDKIIYEKLLQHIEVNNILIEEQFGFGPSASPDKSSCRLVDEVLNALNNRMIVGGIFVTYRKKFDCVNHNVL